MPDKDADVAFVRAIGDIAYQNKAAIYDLLFAASAGTNTSGFEAIKASIAELVRDVIRAP